jgi:ribosomal protection tetracycline resistance protein
VTFSESTTIYKETPRGKGVAFANFGGKNNPFRAAVKLEVEPLTRGEGVRYVSKVSSGYLTRSFQKAVEEAVFESCKKGFYGWEVTDLLITLTDAVFDSVTSTPADFRNLTPIVFMEALSYAQTKLLEPIYRFELTIPGDVAGKAMGDLQSMRAEILETINNEETFSVKGNIPLDPSKDYTVKLASYTEGKGVLMMRFARYDDVSDECIGERAKKLMNPLNTRKYLLEKSNAIQSN